jgi:putative endonuclease
MFTLYILNSEIVEKSYVGITDNLERRIIEHNSGKNFYTKRYLPWKILHTEKYNDRITARKREKYLKSSSGRRLMKKLFKN